MYLFVFKWRIKIFKISIIPKQEELFEVLEIDREENIVWKILWVFLENAIWMIKINSRVNHIMDNIYAYVYCGLVAFSKNTEKVLLCTNRWWC